MKYIVREFNRDNQEIIKVYGYTPTQATSLLDQIATMHTTRGENQYPIKGHDGYVSGWVFFYKTGEYAGYTSMIGA